ncbi:hypothetical protein SAMD00019534_086960 [Acytostelium subglobosum LB1]|uniref:hypothetical protein n=1 Tax=Acytostelium subglobosum LB1 TaxID=1410327 RepID=UPI0006449B99|nr:hypothetical protein SAMD00019534_086960 [Acytostelium subglobosum LB1]GAM25521.1 hypothetical protein SAMD00019534_086960 [Acytostelium subglobosum LB1]|eukprot:XP_012751507.1 hypothetical protein SAMD00019534_086960 [Acytostelium subglobosum LB1]
MVKFDGSKTNQSFKKKPCHFFWRGKCTNGDSCTFSHDGTDKPTDDPDDEYRPTSFLGTSFGPKQCKYWMKYGNCPRDSCPYDHHKEEQQQQQQQTKLKQTSPQKTSTTSTTTTTTTTATTATTNKTSNNNGNSNGKGKVVGDESNAGASTTSTTTTPPVQPWTSKLVVVSDVKGAPEPTEVTSPPKLQSVEVLPNLSNLDQLASGNVVNNNNTVTAATTMIPPTTTTTNQMDNNNNSTSYLMTPSSMNAFLSPTITQSFYGQQLLQQQQQQLLMLQQQQQQHQLQMNAYLSNVDIPITTAMPTTPTTPMASMYTSSPITSSSSPPSASSSSYLTWGTQEVILWLVSINMPEAVYKAFAQQEINGKSLDLIDPADYNELGLTTVGRRKTFESERSQLASKKIDHLQQVVAGLGNLSFGK